MAKSDWVSKTIEAVINLAVHSFIIWACWNTIAPEYSDVLPVSMLHIPFWNCALIILIRQSLWPRVILPPAKE